MSTDSKPRAKRRNRAPAALDVLLDRGALAEALCMSTRSVERLMADSAATRSGLWPIQVQGRSRVVRASVVQAYIDNLPCVEDVAS